ncbi:MAG TPA: hypothetical protein ENK52_04650 [Saprospiraceae bacterium]|nr:hypothetical protein [Saprospiraceae bacterium]
MGNFVENFKKRRALGPKWLSRLTVIIVFFCPLVLVAMGENNLFYYVLDFIIGLAGPDAPLIHLLSYLLCVLAFLIPMGIILQLIGYIKMTLNPEVRKD